jgi:DNA-binding YbaB/EbfC family protein
MSFDPNELMQQVARMQAEMEKAQGELANETVEGTAGGGMVTVTATGAGEITAVRIAPEAVDPDDVEMLQDMIVAAIHEASHAAQALQQRRLGGLSGRLGLPGM